MSILQGHGAESLVMFDLAKAGVTSFPTVAHLPFDLVAVVSDQLIKIQVKSCFEPRDDGPRSKNKLWRFVLRDGSKREYAAGSFDLYALVAVSTGEVGYMLTSDALTKKCVIPTGELKLFAEAQHFADLTLDKALEKLCALKAS